MKPGGEFLVNGEWVPNQFTIYGANKLLTLALNQTNVTWYVGLCWVMPADVLILNTIGEPSGGGYARSTLLPNATDWPTTGTVNGESYIQSKQILFGDPRIYNAPVNRLFITDATGVIAVSSALTSDMIQDDFETNYRLWLR